VLESVSLSRGERVGVRASVLPTELFRLSQRAAASYASLGCLVALLAFPATAANWPNWRGPDNDGISPEKNLPVQWNENKNIRWRVALPDRGNSTPVVWGQRVFITQTIEKENRRTVMCFDRANGKMLWQSGVTYDEKDKTHETNPHCSASPVTDGERVYVPALGETEPPVAVTPDGGAAGSPADPGSCAAAGSGTSASSSPTPGGAPSGPVDLNTADLAALDTLPGVGPATAQAIITYREEHGRFRSVDELLEVRGIGDAKMAELRDRVTVSG